MSCRVFLVVFCLCVVVVVSLWSEDVLSVSEGDDSGEVEDTIWDNVAVIKKGSFEGIDVGVLNELWKVFPAGAVLEIDGEVFLAGRASLRVEGSGGVELRLGEIPVPMGAVSLTGSLGYKGEGIPVVCVVWYKGDKVLREDIFDENAPTGGGWSRFTLSGKTPPEEATHLVFVVKAELPTQGRFWIDEVNLNFGVEQKKEVRILVNQVGYDLACPKRFVVAVNFKPKNVKGVLIDVDNKEVAEVFLSEPKRIIGWNESDWGQWFIRGDFTSFDQEGIYKVCLWVDGKKYVSDEFILGKDLIWEKTVPVVLNGIKIHRCGCEVDGVHKSCHLDDNCSGRSIIGGWHNGGDYGKDKSSLVLSLLAEAYQICMWRIKEDEELDRAFREELDWGVKYVMSRVREDGNLVGNIVASSLCPEVLPEKETDGVVGNEDDRRCGGEASDVELVAYALSCMGYIYPEAGEGNTFYDLSERLTISLVDKGIKGNLLFNSLVFLGEKRGYERYLPYLSNLYPEEVIDSVDAIPRYDAVVGGLATFNLGQAMKNSVEVYTALSEENPFGLCSIKFRGGNSYLIYEKGGKVIGVNERILKVAQLAGKAFKFYPDDSVRALFFEQINWLLGVNPYGVSMVVGLGKKWLPGLVHPYVKAGVRMEQMRGCIPFGVRAFSKEMDVPYIDLGGNASSADEASLGVSVDVMAMYINAVSQYYRVRVHGGDRGKRFVMPSGK